MSFTVILSASCFLPVVCFLMSSLLGLGGYILPVPVFLLFIHVATFLISVLSIFLGFSVVMGNPLAG